MADNKKKTVKKAVHIPNTPVAVVEVPRHPKRPANSGDFPSPYIKVVSGYRGRRTQEQYIEPKVYYSGDPSLHGLERWLVKEKRAIWTREKPEEEMLDDDVEMIWDDPEADRLVKQIEAEDPFDEDDDEEEDDEDTADRDHDGDVDSKTYQKDGTLHNIVAGSPAAVSPDEQEKKNES